MSHTNRSLLIILALVAFAVVVAACAPATTPAPATVVVPQTVVVQQTVVVKETVVAPTATTVPATGTPVPPTPVAKVPDDALGQKGKLAICTDFPYPPQEFFDDKGNPQGSDVEIGGEIAKRLGLQAQFINSVFDTIVAAVKSGKCDIIISAQNITEERKKAVNMIPYFKAGQGMLAQKGNPQKIKTPLDLCGQSAAAESGTTEADYLQGTGDYDPVKGTADSKGKGLAQQCAKAGKPAVKVVVTQKDTDALQQLQAGKVAVYMADSPVVAYYVVQHPDQFEVVGDVIEPALEGISVPCGQDDCTKASLVPLGQAVKAALKSMIADGTYGKILAKWQLTSGALTANDVDAVK